MSIFDIFKINKIKRENEELKKRTKYNHINKRRMSIYWLKKRNRKYKFKDKWIKKSRTRIFKENWR